MVDLYSLSLEELEALEKNPALYFSEFNNKVAWELGCFARNFVIEKYPNKPVVIDIALTSGHVLFRTTTKDGSVFDHDKWVERKKNLVFRTEKSSFMVGSTLRGKKLGIEDALLIPKFDYAPFGGCVPLRLKNLGNMFGTLTVSGLPQEQDHQLVLDILEAFHSKK